MKQRSFEQLIDDIYEVPLAAEGWRSIAPSLQEHIGAPVALFQTRAGEVQLLGNAGPVSGAELHNYEDHLWREDRAMSALQAAPTGEIVADSSLISDSERRRSKFYNDMLGAHGLERGLYASIACCGDNLMFVAAQRSAKFGDYDLAEIEALRRLVPHLHRSYRTWLRIGKTELQHHAAMSALEQMTLGVVIVDAEGKLLFANSLAEEELSHGALTVQHGRVTSRAPQSAQGLRDAIRAATCYRRPIAERVVLRGGGEGLTVYSVLVTPVRGQTAAAWTQGPVAMLLVSRAEFNPSETVALSRLYELTPAEARLLGALLEGERLPAYARKQGIAVSTARTHLQGLFNKMGERRQTDLVRRALADRLLRN